MGDIKRIYNQNRKAIWIIIIIIFFLILILKAVNYFIGKNSLNNIKGNEKNENSYNIVSNTIIQSDKSTISGQSIPKDSLQIATGIIEKFFDYCNKEKYEDAYNLLTDDCKNEIYPSLQDFENFYCKNMFNGIEKNVSAENWIDNIYKVKISQNYLSSGEYNNQNEMQDYVTIDKNNKNEYKLNINGYLGKNKINKECEKEKINIKVVEENRYMNYTIYTYEITNNSYKEIIMDPLTNVDSMYIQDKNNIKYVPYTHELSDSQMIIAQGEKRQLKIKYYSKYISNKVINKIVFSKVVLDYDRYSSFTNKSYYNDYNNFEINI